MKKFGVVLLLFVILVLASCANSPYPILITPDFSKLTPQPTPDAAEERAKGSFTSCYLILTEFLSWGPRGADPFCRVLVQVVYYDKNHYLDKTIPNWEWPPPTLLPTGTPGPKPTVTPIPTSTLGMSL